MEMLVHSAFWIGLGKIIWVNLLLSGDNAVVIALAARALPPQQQKTAVFGGAGAAVIERIVLTIFAVALLTLPWLKIVGGLLLLWIGVKLLVPEQDGDTIDSSDNLFQAIKTILIADLVMSLDNVLAVAAAADSAAPTAELVAMKYTLLVLGLAISIPIVIFGSTLMLKFMERWPVIITAGGALLGWIAGEMMVTDPAIDTWVEHNAPWLEEMRVAAIAGAVLVVIVGMWLAKRQLHAQSAQAEPPNS
jgi:YjbE family integral membrane protein